MSLRRPNLAEFSACCEKPDGWGVALAAFGYGIDNAHIDVLLSRRFCEITAQTVRKLIFDEVLAEKRSVRTRLVGFSDLEAFRDAYTALSETALEGQQSSASAETCFLLQLALLKCLLQTVDRENLRLQGDLKVAQQSDETRASGQSLELHEQLVVLRKHGHSITHRVLRLLFSQVRKLENGHLKKLRASVVGRAWPFPESAWFNPILSVPDPGDIEVLACEYPIAALGAGGDLAWLLQTNKCLTTVFKPYLPGWTQMPPLAIDGGRMQGIERRDQGLLRGFLEVEILLARFVARDECVDGRDGWLDVPDNLRRFLASHDEVAVDGPVQSWSDRRWTEFRRVVVGELVQCLESQGLIERIELVYAASKACAQLGQRVPAGLLTELGRGRLSKRSLAQRLGMSGGGENVGALARAVDKAASALRKTRPVERQAHCARFLVDFLTLRRDLKLAHRTYQLMDQVRLLEQGEEAQLSRSNGTLYDFPCRDEVSPVSRRIRCHAVVKADVRGSTRITDELLARGLNPASHFSLNFFNPVNRLLADFGAEKVFVEGDAVIIAVYEYEHGGGASAVARACCLARKIVQVVSLQNAVNRKHDLPEIELGLGVAFASREPNFLFDEGQKIMISGAINRADRLSSCSALLRRAGFTPTNGAFRVEVLRDAAGTDKPGADPDLLNYNVNGVKLEEQAFLKLQEEIPLRRLQRPGDESASLYFVGQYTDAAGHGHWIQVRQAPVREWEGDHAEDVEPRRRHYFEVIVEEGLSVFLRRLAESLPPEA